MISLATSIFLFAIAQHFGIISATDCKTVSGAPSRSSDDSQSTAACATGYQMVSCGIFGAWGAIDGAYIDSNNVCRAQIGSRSPSGSYVQARARCCKLDPNTKCKSYSSVKSGTKDDALISYTCPAKTVLTGCSAYSPWKKIDGAYPGTQGQAATNERKCTAQNGDHGNGVYAKATCCTDSKLDCYHTYGVKSGKSDDAESVVSCGNPYFMAGCSAWSNGKSAEAWYITDGQTRYEPAKCRARNMNRGKGVYAVAICCKEK